MQDEQKIHLHLINKFTKKKKKLIQLILKKIAKLNFIWTKFNNGFKKMK